jgi:hypothetical protein
MSTVFTGGPGVHFESPEDVIGDAVEGYLAGKLFDVVARNVSQSFEPGRQEYVREVFKRVLDLSKRVVDKHMDLLELQAAHARPDGTRNP